MLTTIIHETNGLKIAEVTTDEIILAREQDALDLMVAPALQGAQTIILRECNLAPDFYDLRTGLAGAILQKFVNYRVKLTITGDFSRLSDNFKAFMDECNRGDDFTFRADIQEDNT